MISLDSIDFIGRGLKRPECVLTTADGRLHTSNWDGGITTVDPRGRVTELLAKDAPVALKPNGIALLGDGSYLLAHLGDSEGGVYQLFPDGRVEPFLLEVEGAPLPPSNYPHLDSKGRVWITVSTRLQPRALGYKPTVADGFVVLVDERGARVVADNLGYTNECVVHPDGKRLFVNETFAKRLSSFDIGPDGSLSNKVTIAEFGPGIFPDGLTFDEQGGIWITSIVSNRVIRIDPDGIQETIVEDADPEHVEWVEAAFWDGTMGRPHLDNVHSRRLRNTSSLAFGGPDRRTIYLGCLLGDAIATFRSPIAGFKPAHWSFPLH